MSPLGMWKEVLGSPTTRWARIWGSLHLRPAAATGQGGLEGSSRDRRGGGNLDPHGPMACHGGWPEGVPAGFGWMPLGSFWFRFVLPLGSSGSSGSGSGEDLEV